MKRPIVYIAGTGRGVPEKILKNDDFAALGQRYDLILAVNGDRSIWDYKRALSADGTYAMTGGSNRQLMDALLFGPVLSMGRQKLGNLLMKPNQADLLLIKELCEAGKVDRKSVV